MNNTFLRAMHKHIKFTARHSLAGFQRSVFRPEKAAGLIVWYLLCLYDIVLCLIKLSIAAKSGDF